MSEGDAVMLLKKKDVWFRSLPLTYFGGLSVVCVVLVLDVVVHPVAVPPEAAHGDHVLVAEVQALHRALARVRPEGRKG